MIVGTIDLEMFKCVSNDMATDEVVITDRQLAHISGRHSQDYELYGAFIPDILKKPDYILEANKPNSAVLLKEISYNNEKIQLVLRFKTSNDPTDYKNSIITFLKIREKEWNRLINNKKILYSSRQM